jgi:hypothetical protein
MRSHLNQQTKADIMSLGWNKNGAVYEAVRGGYKKQEKKK